jgi:hypothetical protein
MLFLWEKAAKLYAYPSTLIYSGRKLPHIGPVAGD